MKHTLALMALLLLTSVAAKSVDYGYVTVTIINRPPRITNLTILPEAYEDTILSCTAKVEDEIPERVTIVYEWYKNGQQVLQPKGKPGDTLSCKALPIDANNLTGEPVIVSTNIKKMPLSVRLQTFALSMSEAAKQTPPVTGFVTGELTSQTSYSGVLFLLLILLILINIIIFVRLTRNPKDLNSTLKKPYTQH
ncbi:MAG: hypothetical protein ABIG95_01725 [Candidatus Woesearchaeota archaeon]